MEIRLDSRRQAYRRFEQTKGDAARAFYLVCCFSEKLTMVMKVLRHWRFLEEKNGESGKLTNRHYVLEHKFSIEGPE